jgi:hypothetical protein
MKKEKAKSKKENKGDQQDQFSRCNTKPRELLTAMTLVKA